MCIRDRSWRALRDALWEVSEDVVNVKTIHGRKKKQTPWWTEQVQTAVKRKMKCFKRWIKTRGVEEREEYVEARREAEQIKRREKESTWERIGGELEEDLQGTRKLIYSIAKSYRKGSAPPTYAIKNEDGLLLTSPSDISERWKEYFEQLLNIPNNIIEEEEQWEERHVALEERGDWQIVPEEVEQAMRKMKSGKAAGEDILPVEILRGASEGGVLCMTEVMNKCWNEGKTPEDWTKSVLCPIYKKGDKTDCKNYRGIALMPHIAKVYERILERRLKDTCLLYTSPSP